MIYQDLEKQRFTASSNENLLKNLQSVQSNISQKDFIDKFEKSRQEELIQMEQRYQMLLNEKDTQHKEFLEEIDQLMLEQENEIADLKEKNELLVKKYENNTKSNSSILENQNKLLNEVYEIKILI